MDDVTVALRVIAVIAAFAVFTWILIALVLAARRGGKGFRAIGAALMLFGWGNLRDPRNDTVAEAQDGRIRKSESSGEPLDS